MSTYKTYTGVSVPPSKPTGSRPRFSLTSDIVSFRRCGRQYGYFGNDGFVPAQAVQIFYGTVVHQVLDRCHRHYSGLTGAPPKTMPSDADIDHYFGEVENALRSHGVRPASPNVADKAKRVLKIFNRVEGPQLYPRVFDTEYRLESDRGQYLLRGVVDVLATGSGADSDPSKMEIWDYKGTKFPDLSSQTMQDYVWQMCVYAELYRVRAGAYPAKAVLYFLNELDQDPEPTTRPLRAVHEVQFTPKMIQNALQQFHLTAQDIMKCQTSHTWPTPVPPSDPGKETCDICDIRWNCPAKKGVYPRRMPI
jgi:hypothetical protein